MSTHHENGHRFDASFLFLILIFLQGSNEPKRPWYARSRGDYTDSCYSIGRSSIGCILFHLDRLIIGVVLPPDALHFCIYS